MVGNSPGGSRPAVLNRWVAKLKTTQCTKLKIKIEYNNLNKPDSDNGHIADATLGAQPVQHPSVLGRVAEEHAEQVAEHKLHGVRPPGLPQLDVIAEGANWPPLESVAIRLDQLDQRWDILPVHGQPVGPGAFQRGPEVDEVTALTLKCRALGGFVLCDAKMLI
jgi:hypothetical protein